MVARGRSMNAPTLCRFESGYRPEMPEMHLQNSKNFRVEKSGEIIVGSRIFKSASGFEDSLALRLTSELVDLRAGNRTYVCAADRDMPGCRGCAN